MSIVATRRPSLTRARFLGSILLHHPEPVRERPGEHADLRALLDGQRRIDVAARRRAACTKRRRQDRTARRGRSRATPGSGFTRPSASRSRGSSLAARECGAASRSARSAAERIPPRVLSLATRALLAHGPLADALAALATLLASALAPLLEARSVARPPGSAPGRADEVVVGSPGDELVDVRERDERVREQLVDLRRRERARPRA